MSSWFKERGRSLLDNAAYEGVRLLILAVVLPAVYAGWRYVRQQPLQWTVLFVFIAIGLLALALIAIGSLRKKNHGLMQPKDPQPAIVAIDELKALLNEGEILVNRFQIDSVKPTLGEVENWRKRMRECARQKVLATENLVSAKDLLKLDKRWDEGEVLRITAKFVDHGCFADGSVEMAVFQSVWGHIQRLKELIAKIESEESSAEKSNGLKKPASQSSERERQIRELNENIARRSLRAALHRLKISCAPDIEGCVKETLFTSERLPTNFFRVRVEAGGRESIKNCTGFLKRIEKNGKTKWGGDSAQLTFAQGEDPDAFAKTIRTEVPQFLDVIAITSKGEIYPGTYRTTAGRFWPYKPTIPEIFSELGDYVLTVVITGDGVPPVTSLLKFTWTRDWQTAGLRLISPRPPASVDTKGGSIDEDKPLRPIEIRDALDDFIRDGERLLERWNSRNDAVIASEVDHQTLQWLTAATAFVKRNLDVRHVDQLSQYQMTVKSKDRWNFSFSLANRGIDITVHRIAYELGYKVQILRYFRDEIH